MLDSSDREARLERIQAGQEANLVGQIVKPYIEDAISQKVKLLTANYRAREFDFPLMLGLVAEISALQALISNLENTVNQGYIAADKEFTNGKAT